MVLQNPPIIYTHPVVSTVYRKLQCPVSCNKEQKYGSYLGISRPTIQGRITKVM